MKKLQFDLEKAKSGAKLVTRDGKPARIICLDFKHENNPIIVLIEEGEGKERAVACMANGCKGRDVDSDDDLFILEEPTIRPYANAEEILNDMKEHGPMVMFKGNCYYFNLSRLSKDTVVIRNSYYSFDEFKDKHEWQDGHPCGVEEGGELCR